ncbi:MAG: SDR family oxidoreductase [Acidimicrobiia bacterium]
MGNFPALDRGISLNGFKTVVDIDLLGTYNVSKAAFEVWLREHGGNIVNITAPFEMRGGAAGARRCGEGGVDSLTAPVRWSGVATGIRANAVGSVRIGNTEVKRFSEAVPGSTPTTTVPRRCANNPVGLPGHGADIANMVMYFCSLGRASCSAR